MADSRTKRTALIGAPELRERLEAQRRGAREDDRIFRDGTWVDSSINGSSYDLRVAPDRLILPDGKRHDEENPLESPFVLEAGDIAAVGTVEELCMPWDVGGLVAPKFSTISEGLLVLHGGVLDPGYGLTRRDGAWVAGGERFYVLIANVSGRPIIIEPGRRSLLRVSFFRVEERADAEKEEVPAPEAFKRGFRAEHHEPPAALAFFTDATRVKSTVERVEANVNNVVLVGYAVFALAVLGAVVAILIALLESNSANDAGPGAVVVSVAICVAAVVIAFVAAWAGRGRGSTALDLAAAQLLRRFVRRDVRRRLEQARLEAEWAAGQARLAKQFHLEAIDELAKARNELERARAELVAAREERERGG